MPEKEVACCVVVERRGGRCGVGGCKVVEVVAREGGGAKGRGRSGIAGRRGGAGRAREVERRGHSFAFSRPPHARRPRHPSVQSAASAAQVSVTVVATLFTIYAQQRQSRHVTTPTPITRPCPRQA